MRLCGQPDPRDQFFCSIELALSPRFWPPVHGRPVCNRLDGGPTWMEQEPGLGILRIVPSAVVLVLCTQPRSCSVAFCSRERRIHPFRRSLSHCTLRSRSGGRVVVRISALNRLAERNADHAIGHRVAISPFVVGASEGSVSENRVKFPMAAIRGSGCMGFLSEWR